MDGWLVVKYIIFYRVCKIYCYPNFPNIKFKFTVMSFPKVDFIQLSILKKFLKKICAAGPNWKNKIKFNVD